jgi:hypothetical protein
LNVVLSFSRQAQVDEDDDKDDINVEDYDGADDESIKEEEEDINYNVIFIDKILHKEVFILLLLCELVYCIMK